MIAGLKQIIIDFFQVFYTHGLRSFFISLVFLLGLLYLILPGPSSIGDFPILPESTKSQLEGDTVQNPNLVAYFSQFKREYITEYYWNYYKDWSYLGIHLPLFKINHPPERAFTFIRDQQESSALEEYYLPFRESLFVNVYDPVIYNQVRRKEVDFWTSHLEYNGNYYGSKTTIRYYSSSLTARVSVYILSFFMFFLLIRLFDLYTKQK